MGPTPTPILSGTPSFDIGVDVAAFGQNMAGGFVQGWNLFDAQSFAGVVWFILLAIVIIAGLVSIRKHLDTL